MGIQAVSRVKERTTRQATHAGASAGPGRAQQAGTEGADFECEPHVSVSGKLA